MSPTLYTARDNGKRNNSGNTTMVTCTTMASNGIWFFNVQSVIPCLGVTSDRVECMEHSLPAMWGNIRSIAEMECVQSVKVDIFHLRYWSVEVSPYTYRAGVHPLGLCLLFDPFLLKLIPTTRTTMHAEGT